MYSFDAQITKVEKMNAYQILVSNMVLIFTLYSVGLSADLFDGVRSKLEHLDYSGFEACLNKGGRPVYRVKLSAGTIQLVCYDGSEKSNNFDNYLPQGSGNFEGSESAQQTLGADRVPAVGKTGNIGNFCQGRDCGGTASTPWTKKAGRIGAGDVWHNGPEYSGRKDFDRQEAFYFVREVDRKERQRFIQEYRQFVDQKTAYVERVQRKLAGTVTQAEIAKEESENETMLPWVIARLEGRSMDQKGEVHWPYITNDRGLIRGWDSEHSILNNADSYQFQTSPGNSQGRSVRDIYNYALYLNMVSFSYKNLDYLQAATIALDFVEQADKNFKNIGGNEQLALRKLGYAQRIVDYKTGRYFEKGYDKAMLKANVKEYFNLNVNASHAFGYEVIQAANALEEFMPRFNGDSEKTLSIPELDFLVKIAFENAAIAFTESQIEQAYGYLDNVWAMANFMKGLGAGAIKEAINNLDPIEVAKGFASLYQFSAWALSNAYDQVSHTGDIKINDIKNWVWATARSSPKIMNDIANMVDEQYDSFLQASQEDQGRMVGTIAVAAASFFFNPSRLIDKAGKASKIVEGFAKATEHAVYDAHRLNRGVEIIAKYSPNNPGPLHVDDAATFLNRKYTEKVLTENLRVYRVFDEQNKAFKKGRFFTREKPVSPYLSKIDLALPHIWVETEGMYRAGNRATNWVEVDLPLGTRLFEGRAASQGAFPGGGSQIFIDIAGLKQPDSWYGKIH